jgi:CubicO group peptidase (beta-lactamase class C family)
MTRSGFDYRKAPALKATGYYVIDGDKTIPSAVIDSSISFSAGAIYTTPEDLVKWDISLMQQPVISAASLRDAWTPRMNKYGLGWFIDTIHQKPAIHHGGSIDGFMTQNIIAPQEGISVTVIINAEMYDGDKVARDILGILYGIPAKLPEMQKEIAVHTSVLQQYTGLYEINPQMKATVSVADGKLIITPEGQPATELYAESESVFFFKIMDARIEFVKDGSGKVVKFIFRQGDRTMEALKKQ